MNKFFKRLALVLVIVMALVMIPVSLAAADPLPADADPAVWDKISLTRADGTSLVKGTDYTVTKGKYSHYAYSEPFTYNIYNVTTSDPIVISGGAAYKNSSLTYPLKSRITLGADVTSVTLKDVTALGELSVTEGSNVDFTLAGENYVDKILGTGLTTTITFGGEGSLTGEHIGGVDKYGADPATNVGCNIVINSGTFNITAGYKSAIGGGQYGNSGKITINGGNITAKSNYGAAIGGGQNGSATEIVITDGEINATGSFGAAIGGGQRGGAENISISGGTIEAKGSHVGAAIGGGQDGDVGTVEITDGDITVIARSIGIGGQDAKNTKNISISGGNIELKKLNSSSQEIPADAGMIGVANGSTDAVEISGGSFNVELPEDYLAEGTEIKKNEDGTYGVKAASVAKIGTVEYASLAEAIAAAKDDDVIVVSAGKYKLNGSLTYTGKAFTIKAADGAKVSFDMSAAVALHGAKITFEGVTFDYKTNGNYIGIQHADTLVYNNCTINGQVFLYATNETFNVCKFNQTSAGAYNVWTYGAKNVKFNGCVFNCVGKSVLLYNEGANTGTDLTVTDTTFNASASVEGKAAIEIDTSLMGGQSKITVDKATADKTTGFANGSNSGNTLWNDKKQTADTNQNTTVVVDGKTVFEPANFIDLDLFIKWLANNGYNVDGANYISNINAVVDGKLTVKWSPVSGCYDARTGHACTVNGVIATGNTPKRVNSGLTQFQLFEGLNTAVIIKNVKFVYEPAAFTVCENSGWKGSYTAEQAPAGQLYFMTTGNVTVDSCDFEKVVFTTFNTTGTSTVNNCTFKDVYNNYAIKDIRGGKVSVTGTKIENCGGGIMVSSTGTVSNVIITRNTFNNVDTAGTAPEGKVGTRAILQIASLGKYENTAFDFSGNSATSCGPVIRQLNATVAPVGSSLKYLTEGTNSASGLYTSDSKVTYVAEVTFVDGTVEKYETLIEALKAGLSGKEGTITKLLANGTVSGVTIARIIDLNGYTLTTDDLNLDSSNGKDLIVTDSSNDKNGKLVITGSANMNIAHKIILNAGTIETSRTINQNLGTNNTIEINGGTLILKNGATLTNSMPRTVTINGGTIITDAGKSIFKAGSSTLDVKIKGGDFIQVGKLTESTSNIKFSISGGTFSADVPEEYCAKDYYPAHFNDGTKGVKKETVSTEKELRRALYEAALDGSLTRIKLTGNIKLEMLYAAENFGTEKLDDNAIGDTFNRYKFGVHPTAEKPDHWNPLVINQTQEERVVYGAYYHVSATDERIARLVIKAGQNVVIDLNGYTIEKNARATHGDWSETCTDIIGNYGTLEIKDSAETKGTIKGNGYISCNGAVLHNYEGGVMTVGAVNVDGNAAAMTAGTGQYVIANDGGKTIINGTNVYDTATSASLVVNTAGEITITGNATLNHPATKTINVKGGDVIIESATIISDKYSIYAAKGKTTITGEITVNGTGKMAVKGGEIVKTANATVGGVPEGYAWFDNADGTQSLSKAYAKIGETYYKSLADAIKAANAGDTIVLLDNVTLNSPLAISKDVTIDLNKKTIDTKAGVRAITITSGNVTIKNGTVKMGTVVNGSTSESGYTIYVNTAKGENVTLNLENVTVIGGENQKSGVTDATVDALKANGMYSYQTTAGTALYIYGKMSDGNTIVNIKNSTIIGGYGSATNGTQTKYISDGANMADGGDAITAIGDNVVLTIIDGSTIKGGDSDLRNAGIGVELQSGTLTVDGSTVTGGSCLKCDKSYGIAGDAVYVGSVAKSATIKNSTIIGGNGGYSYDGSGIEIRKNDNAPAIVTVEDSTIKSGNGENANKDYAGAIYLGGWDDSADLTFKGDNTLAGSDGKYGVIRGGVTDGIKLDGNLTIDEGTLKNTLLTKVSAGSTIKSGENAKVDADTVASTDENAAMNTTPAADGTYSFVAAVAQVIDRAGNKLSYASIDAAIAAADAGETVKLLADVTADVVINKNITLDLGGKTLTNTGKGKATISVTGGTVTVKNGTVIGGTSYYNIEVTKGSNANLTLEDVTATAGNTGSSMIDNWGTLTIKSGTYTGGLNVVKSEEGSTLVINGGMFTLEYATSGYTGVIFAYGTTTITGGEFIQNLTTTGRWNHPQVILAGVVEGYTSSVIVTGGKFTNKMSRESIFRGVGKATSDNFEVSGGTFNKSVSQSYFTKGYECVKKADGTYGVQEATKGSKNYPYTLAELSVMTRDEYIAAQKALGGTMYVEIGDYSYDKNGVLGNGVRNDTPGQTEDRSVLNGYNSNGYLGDENDGANGKNIIFVGGSITSGVTGYASIDNIGTSLLLAVPAYTNVTFEGVTFKNVISFDYQLYTGPWSQLGKLKFDNCKFNGLIVGAIASQTLTFNKCTFTNYINTISANNSNPTWIRPAYGNWSKGDNEGQGSDFKSLTTINFTNNTVTSTRPVKFERIAQWEMDTKVTVKNNKVTISAQEGDTSTKSVGFYFGANAKFDLTLDGNKKLGATSALYTAVYKAPNGTDYAGLPAGSTVKDSNGADVEVAGVIWKTTDALTLKTTTEAVELVNSKGISVKFATLEEAFAAAKNGDTITLLSDVEMTEIIRVTDSKKITLALNGFNVTITATGKFIRVCNAELTITGNGTIKEQNPYFAPIIIKGGAEGSENYSVVNIKEGVTLEGWAGVMIDQTSGTANNYGMVLNVEGATLNGVNDTDGASGSGIYVNGVVEDAKITLTNTTVTGTGAGMYLAGNADTTINGGSVKGDATGIEIRAGKLTLNNCDVTGGNGEVTATANGNGTTVTNAALAISQHTTKKPIEVIINGGTFNGKAAVYQTDVQGTGSADVKIAVNDGTFNGTISGETDGTITISGGKFKVKVDDKYFADKLACSATPNADGYYTVKDHPIISAGISIGEDMSFRIMVEEGYENGSLKYYYIGVNGRVEGEGTIGTDTQGNSIFRIYNVNPQRADLIYVIQYYDADGNAIGAPKEISVLTYFEGFYNMEAGKNEDVEARKTFIANFLEYCASAMERSYADFPKETLDGKTWQYRADAVRAMMTRLGLKVADYEFKGNLGRYYNDNAKGNITDRGIVFGSTFRAYYEISKDIIDSGCRVFRQGTDVTDKLVLENGAYRFYFELAPYEFKDSLTITIYNGTTKVCEYSSPLANTLKAISESTNVSASKLAKAAFNYFVALQNYEG